MSQLIQVPQEKMAELCFRSFSTFDGLWFLAVEEKYGSDTALEIDKEVWQRGISIHAKRLVKNLPIKKDNPLQAFVSLVQADPIMSTDKPREIVTLADNKAILRCSDCPTQKARIKAGKGEFPCKTVSIAIYSAYAEAVDPRIKLTGSVCPPDAHPPEYFCEWQFEI